EQEQGPEERHECLGVVFPQGRPNDVVADEGQQRLEGVPEPALRQSTVAGAPGYGQVNDQDQGGGDQLQDHELGDLEAENVGERDLDALEQFPRGLRIDDVVDRTWFVSVFCHSSLPSRSVPRGFLHPTGSLLRGGWASKTRPTLHGASTPR